MKELSLERLSVFKEYRETVEALHQEVHKAHQEVHKAHQKVETLLTENLALREENSTFHAQTFGLKVQSHIYTPKYSDSDESEEE